MDGIFDAIGAILVGGGGDSYPWPGRLSGLSAILEDEASPRAPSPPRTPCHEASGCAWRGAPPYSQPAVLKFITLLIIHRSLITFLASRPHTQQSPTCPSVSPTSRRAAGCACRLPDDCRSEE